MLRAMQIRDGHTSPLTNGGRLRLLPVFGYPASALLIGAGGGYVSLVVPGLGFVAAILVEALLIRKAGGERWTTVGGFMIGLGAVVAALLRPALTNQDPAVHYDPSTVPVLIVGVTVALVGVGILVSAALQRVRVATSLRSDRHAF